MDINIWTAPFISRELGMHTHRQPSYPPIPSIFAMANASNPENAPPDAADEYKRAIRVCVSSGRYHFEIRRMAPGKNPALIFRSVGCPSIAVKLHRTHSKRPRKNLIETRPPKFCTTPVRVIMMPQARTRDPRYIEGRLNWFNIMLLGTSAVLLAFVFGNGCRGEANLQEHME